jgi:DNA-binding transcriptional regulator YiaG
MPLQDNPKNHISELAQDAADTITIASLRRRLLEYRAKHNITQRQFAEIANLSRTTVQQLERSRWINAISQIKVYRIVNDQLL